MTNPDPLEVWDAAYKAWQNAWPHRDPEAADQAAAAIIAHHYAPMLAEVERLREFLLDEDWLEETITDSLEMDWNPRDAAKLIIERFARQALGEKS